MKPATKQPAPPSPRPLYDEDLIRLGAPENPPRSPGIFFVGGVPRSGTNWVGALLNSHPHVVCTGEFTFHNLLQTMAGFVAGPNRPAHFEPTRTAAARAFQDFVRTCVRSIAARKPGAKFAGDHTPRPIRLILPDAAYFVIHRDGRDVLVSWTFNVLARRSRHAIPAALRPLFDQHLPAPDAGSEAITAAAHRLLALGPWVRFWARRWAAHVRHDARTIEGVRSGRLPGRIHSLRYEDLHTDTVGQRARMLQFLGVDPALASAPSQHDRTAPGFEKEDPASHYRRGAVGDWKGRMSPQAVRWYEQAAAAELTMLAYPLHETKPTVITRPAPVGAGATH